MARASDKLVRLLQLIALQVGKEVAIVELGRQLSMGKNTVKKYLDLVEEGGEDLNGYEIKWGRRRPSPPASWKKAYPKAGYHVIHPGNYLEYITG